MQSEDQLKELKAILMEVSALNHAQGVLGWDQATYMPPGGAPARGRSLAVLARISHEKFTDPAVGKLLDALEPYGESLPYDSDEAGLIRATRRQYDRATRIPSDFLADWSELTTESYQVWALARPANDFASVQPYLEKILDFSRRAADFFPGYDHIADPLIDMSDYGMKAAMIRALFAELRAQLAPIAQAITEQAPADDSCLRLNFPEAPQLAFANQVVARLGYDFERGRQDKTHHPFTTSFSIGDVRITTRVKEDYLGECLFSAIHEAGHALYEQGSDPAFEGTPLAGGTSSGVHESQSRLWENVVGRSLGFWEYFYPELQNTFPEQLKGISLETFYRAVNKVERSLIRTDADEVTYNLHVMLRFEFELEMLEGKLAIRDLPEVWHTGFEQDFGLRAPDDRDGVLQDVHWYAGGIGGAFQGYTLGNILSASFYNQALQAHPAIPEEIRQGEFGMLLGWLRDNIYCHGSKFTAPELIERVTGGPLRIEPYIQYLRTKYGALYSL